MMSDLISRQAAIEAIERNAYRHTYIEQIVNIIKDLPSVQPEWKKGKWIRNDNGTYSCSVCQSWIPEEQHCYSRYCLYCGCQMEGDV